MSTVTRVTTCAARALRVSTAQFRLPLTSTPVPTGVRCAATDAARRHAVAASTGLPATWVRQQQLLPARLHGAQRCGAGFGFTRVPGSDTIADYDGGSGVINRNFRTSPVSPATSSSTRAASHSSSMATRRLRVRKRTLGGSTTGGAFTARSTVAWYWATTVRLSAGTCSSRRRARQLQPSTTRATETERSALA